VRPRVAPLLPMVEDMAVNERVSPGWGSPSWDGGFTITELLVSIAFFVIVIAVGSPMLLSTLGSQRLNAAARDVQSELQGARLRAVSANRPMRVRFNCPSANQFRAVELIGTPSVPDALDGAVNRCDPVTYPYVPKDRNVLTRPNNDGAVRALRQGVSFTSATTVEFWPDGTAHADTGGGNPWPAIPSAGATIKLSYKTDTKTITVNGFGKVSVQ